MATYEGSVTERISKLEEELRSTVKELEYLTGHHEIGCKCRAHEAVVTAKRVLRGRR